MKLYREVEVELNEDDIFDLFVPIAPDIRTLKDGLKRDLLTNAFEKYTLEELEERLDLSWVR